MVGVIQEILRVQALSGGLNPIGMSLAGGVIIFMPLFLVFLFCQRYFIKGLALGGVKE
jgi:ABC-type glycerol-3-phosphate transport system permease component